jgi:hypothetical protein
MMNDESAAANAKAKRAISLSGVPPVLVAAGLLIVAIAMTWPGAYLIVQRQTGVRMQAKVDDCEVYFSGYHNRLVHCTGTWILGGSLFEGGHVVVGTIEGADTDDIGKTIDVTLSPDGETAYTRDIRLALAFIVVGVITGIGFLWWVGLMIRARNAPPAS